MQHSPRTQRRPGPVGQILAGGAYPFRGLRLVTSHPSTWPYLVLPSILTAGLFFVALFVSWHAVPALMGTMWVPTIEHHWLVHLGWRTSMLLLRALAFLAIAVALYATAGLLAIPFNDRLSEKIETLYLGPYEQPFSWRVVLGDLSVSVSHTLISAVLWIGVMGLLLGLELVPGLGSALHVVLGASITGLFLAREMMDGCMSRRRMAYRHKLRVLRANLWTMIGFGVCASVLLGIPGLNFFLLPMIVVGGSLMYCELEEAGRIPDASGAGPFVSERVRVRQRAEHTLSREREALDVV